MGYRSDVEVHHAVLAYTANSPALLGMGALFDDFNERPALNKKRNPISRDRVSSDGRLSAITS
jgi:hypothetical protein